ncbi:Response regulator receiver domain-containing protein [Salipiger thiooxidans]|uniref:Response regulator receiver domain-containing protein n=1 Tax=Salipiger thiooxidans TaxID=282683 RepID=A0A1G7G939_9RHOB|nr:response regulator [Salipiger thiooxidans]SDE84658.1 Response regulator receiver domain-containing protein [Salipiger thiooxidans]
MNSGLRLFCPPDRTAQAAHTLTLRPVVPAVALWLCRAVRILLVEDHEGFAATIAVRLGRDGQSVDIETDGNRAAALLSHKDFDLVLLDVNLPGHIGFESLRELRLAGDDIPLLVLTPRGEIDERIPGPDTGADDFVVKPVDLGELAARWSSTRPTGWPWSCCCCHGARGDRTVAAACPGAARGARGAADRADPLDPRRPLRAGRRWCFRSPDRRGCIRRPRCTRS